MPYVLVIKTGTLSAAGVLKALKPLDRRVKVYSLKSAAQSDAENEPEPDPADAENNASTPATLPAALKAEGYGNYGPASTIIPRMVAIDNGAVNAAEVIEETDNSPAAIEMYVDYWRKNKSLINDLCNESRKIYDRLITMEGAKRRQLCTQPVVAAFLYAHRDEKRQYKLRDFLRGIADPTLDPAHPAKQCREMLLGLPSARGLEGKRASFQILNKQWREYR